MPFAPSEDSDEPGHPLSLIRVFAGRSMGSQGSKLSSCGQRRHWSDWAEAQADLSFRWAHMSLCWFYHEAAHFKFRTVKYLSCCSISSPTSLQISDLKSTYTHTLKSRRMTKQTKWPVRPAKTQISLGIRPVWSESLLSIWRRFGSLDTHKAHSEDSDQTGRMHRLIWVFTGCTCHFVGFVKMTVRPAENQISLGIRPVWSESSLSA